MAIKIARKKSAPKPPPPKVEEVPEVRRPSLGRRLWPAILFMVILVAMVIAFYNPSAKSHSKSSDVKHALQSTKDRYAVTKARFNAMRTSADTDEEAFLLVSKDFYEIYDSDDKWPNRPAALLRSAIALESAAHKAEDDDVTRHYRLAVSRYKELAAEFKHSVLADDALLQASKILWKKLGNSQESLRLLKIIIKNYQKGDMYKKSLALVKAIQGTVKKPARAEQKTRPEKKPNQQAIKQTPKQDAVKNSAPAAKAKKPVAVYEKHPKVPTFSKEKKDLARELKALAVPAQKPKAEKKVAVVEKKESKAQKKISAQKPAPQAKAQSKAEVKPVVQVVAKTRLQKSAPQVKAQPKVTAKAAPKPAVQVAEKASLPKPKQNVQKIAPKPQKPSLTELKTRLSNAKLENMAAQLGLNIRTVYIDIGHGGKDQGTAHNGLIERDVVLDIGKRVGRILQRQGFNVIYSRTSDTFLTLSRRSKNANSAGADIFLSIHMNAFPDASIQGFETYYLDFSKSSRASHVAMRENASSDRKLGDLQNVLTNMLLNVRTKESINLASDIQRSTIGYVRGKGFTTKSGGTRSAPFHVLMGTSMPAVLVEVGYCTHAKEAKMLKTASYREALAEGISRGIVRYKARIERSGNTYATLP